MSDSRKNSGVSSLRAMFENQNKSDSTTSPPSRGRSPNDSERSTSTGPRPLSKVRTNFVAVERPGESAPLIGLRKQSDIASGSDEIKSQDMTISEEGENAVDGAAEAAATTAIEKGLAENVVLKVNGAADNRERQKETVNGVTDGNLAVEDKKVPGAVPEHTPISSDKTISRPEDGQTGEPETTKGAKSRESLGNILKGSAFENSPASKIETSGKQPVVKQPKSPSTPLKAKPPGPPSKALGRAKEPISPKKHASSVTTPSDSKPSKKEVSSPKVTPRPANISTGKDVKPVSKPPTLKSPSVSRTPKTPTTPSNRRNTDDSTPVKQAVPKEPVKAATKKPSRVSLQSASAAPITSWPRAAPKSPKDDPTKKSAVSPTTKPKPKSPTRPVRLPTHLTAPTASSVAKTHAAPPSRSPSRTSNVGSTLARHSSIVKRDRAAPNLRTAAPTATSTIRKKTSRASLPSHSSANQDRPRSRVSNVGSKAPDESFLARMMRPTASSASKVHEKIEPKSPPRRSGTVKGKRKSEGKDEDVQGQTPRKETKIQEAGGAIEGEEHVDAGPGESEALGASVVDEEKEAQNATVEDETPIEAASGAVAVEH